MDPPAGTGERFGARFLRLTPGNTGVRTICGAPIERGVASSAYGCWPVVDPRRPLTIGRRDGIMKVMAAEEQLVHVTLSGDINGEYVVKDIGPDGEITLVPDTSWKAILTRGGGKELTPQQWEDFLAEHGPHMLPPDSEG
jgi:hypothetical protein